MQLAPVKDCPPPHGIPILAQIEYIALGRPMTERIVCVIDDEGNDTLLSEGGDDIGWDAEVIVAWSPLPPHLKSH
jgi:hypothetical protein